MRQMSNYTIYILLITFLFGLNSCKKTNDDTTIAAVPTITTLTCNSTLFSTTATTNTNYSGTATVPYVGGNGTAYPIGSAIASSGVLGLTATLNAGTLANGSGNLVYRITGNPTSAGNASFTISFAGKSCTLTLSVNNSTPFIGGLACFGAVFSSRPTRNVPYVGTVSVLYASGNGASYPAGSPIQSTGVTGLTATLVAGTLQNGAGSSGNLIYNISGTPIFTTISSATFALNFGTLGCGITVGVN